LEPPDDICDGPDAPLIEDETYLVQPRSIVVLFSPRASGARPGGTRPGGTRQGGVLPGSQKSSNSLAEAS
jgi:hypothetical protein